MSQTKFTQEWESLQSELRKLGQNSTSIAESLSIRFSVESGFEVGGHSEYETRLIVKNNGEGKLFRRRDSSDTNQEPPGLFRGRIPESEINGLIQAITDNQFGIQPINDVEPRDTAFRMELTLFGKVFIWAWGAAEVEACEGLQGVLAYVYDWGANYFLEPEWSLGIDVCELRATRDQISGALKIINTGDSPIYLPLPEDNSARVAIFQYGKKQIITPGVTPLPMELSKIKLNSSPRSRLELACIPGSGSFLIHFQQSLNQPLPDPWLGSFCLVCYCGSDQIAGQNVFSGVIFSAEVGG